MSGDPECFLQDSHWRPALLMTELNARSTAQDEAVGSPGREINTTSCPGQGPAARRTAARRTLLHRLRMTALPSLLPATKATRPDWSRPSGVLATRTMTSGWATRAAVRKIVSISRDDLMVLMRTRRLRRRVPWGTRRSEPCVPCAGVPRVQRVRRELPFALENRES